VLSIGKREPGNYTMPVAAEWVHIDESEFPGTTGVLSKLARIAVQREYPVPDVFAASGIHRRVQSMVGRVRPDIIVLSNWKNRYPAPLRTFGNVIVDMHNVESLLGVEVQHFKSTFVRRFVSWRWRARERDLVRQGALTWVCGHNDITELKRLDPRLPTPMVVPNAVDVGRYEDVRSGSVAVPTGLERNGATLVYIGLYRYEPNATAALELIRNVFPRVAERLPNARLVLVGGDPTDAMKAAAQSDPRITVTGKVDDTRPYLSLADLCAVPLQSGGGTRLKILECFAAKIPVVSTRKGAEGIDARDGRDLRLADTSEDIARNAVELLIDAEARRKQADCAYELVERSYSWHSLAEHLDEALPAAYAVTLRDVKLPSAASAGRATI
jgi:polysaccharide biosynthesis protein PslH